MIMGALAGAGQSGQIIRNWQSFYMLRRPFFVFIVLLGASMFLAASARADICQGTCYDTITYYINCTSCHERFVLIFALLDV